MTDTVVNRPVEMRISLGNILTIGAMIAGFLGVFYTQGQNSQSQRSDISGLKDQFAELKTDIKDLSGNVSEEKISLTRFEDWKTGVEAHFSAVEEHLKATDSARDGLKTEVQSLENAVNVINGEVGKKGR